MPVKRDHLIAPSAWRRVVARVAGWPAPPHNLLLSALVLLVFPWDDVLIDAIYSGDPRLSAVTVYIVWMLFDVSLIWVMLASGRMLRPALVYAAITALLGVILAVVYYDVTQYSAPYMVATGCCRSRMWR